MKIFQDINRVSQAAVTSAKGFLASLDVSITAGGEYEEEELDDWLTFSFNEFSFDEVYRELFDESVKLILNTVQMVYQEMNED